MYNIVVVISIRTMMRPVNRLKVWDFTWIAFHRCVFPLRGVIPLVRQEMTCFLLERLDFETCLKLLIRSRKSLVGTAMATGRCGQLFRTLYRLMYSSQSWAVLRTVLCSGYRRSLMDLVIGWCPRLMGLAILRLLSFSYVRVWGSRI